MNALELLKAVQLAFILDQPGYGVLSYKLKPVVDDKCPTAWTDGKTLGVNPKFVESMDKEHRKFVYAHELLHCAFLHPMRRGNRDSTIWNMACDFAINIHLKDAKFSVLDYCLIDEKYRGKPAEVIYDDLMQHAKQLKAMGNKWNIGDTKDSNENGAGAGDLEQEWKVASVQAANAQKSFGKESGCFEELVKAITTKKLGFEGWLQRLLSKVSRDDYSFRRFNRRKALLGVQLPGLRNMTLGDLVIAVDASGSVDNDKLSKFFSKIERLRNQFPCKIDLLVFDTKVNVHKTFEAHEKLAYKVKGRGGTNFKPVFSYIAEKKLDVAALIVFTDMEGPFPEKAPLYDVLWAAYNTTKIKAPFGSICYFEG